MMPPTMAPPTPPTTAPTGPPTIAPPTAPVAAPAAAPPRAPSGFWALAKAGAITTAAMIRYFFMGRSPQKPPDCGDNFRSHRLFHGFNGRAVRQTPRKRASDPDLHG